MKQQAEIFFKKAIKTVNIMFYVGIVGGGVFTLSFYENTENNFFTAASYLCSAKEPSDLFKYGSYGSCGIDEISSYRELSNKELLKIAYPHSSENELFEKYKELSLSAKGSFEKDKKVYKEHAANLIKERLGTICVLFLFSWLLRVFFITIFFAVGRATTRSTGGRNDLD